MSQSRKQKQHSAPKFNVGDTVLVNGQVSLGLNEHRQAVDLFNANNNPGQITRVAPNELGEILYNIRISNVLQSFDAYEVSENKIKSMRAQSPPRDRLERQQLQWGQQAPVHQEPQMGQRQWEQREPQMGQLQFGQQQLALQQRQPQLVQQGQHSDLKLKLLGL